MPRAACAGRREVTRPALPVQVRMKTHVAYEAAFEHYLRARQTPYVAVDEARRVAFRDAKLKSFDFIVYSSRHTNWLVDIKGRRWALRKGDGRPAWENWATLEDLDGLEQWQTVFGGDFAGLLVFAYWLDATVDPPMEIVHAFRDQRYVFAGVRLEEYRDRARQRSAKWGTVHLATADYSRLVRPMVELL